MTRHPHRPDRIAAGTYLAAFIAIFTSLTTAAVAVALITTGRLT